VLILGTLNSPPLQRAQTRGLDLIGVLQGVAGGEETGDIIGTVMEAAKGMPYTSELMSKLSAAGNKSITNKIRPGQYSSVSMPSLWSPPINPSPSAVMSLPQIGHIT